MSSAKVWGGSQLRWGQVGSGGVAKALLYERRAIKTQEGQWEGISGRLRAPALAFTSFRDVRTFLGTWVNCKMNSAIRHSKLESNG